MRPGELHRPRIRTPDQRIRVFISSTLEELAEERAAARRAIEKLRLTPVMFELGARPHPPRELYRAYVDQSQIFVGIYWQRYGAVVPGMTVSGLEDEYRLSASHPRLIYVKSPAPEREERLSELLEAIRRENLASYKPFSTNAELQDLIENDLALLLSERFGSGSGGEGPSASPEIASTLRGNVPGMRARLVGRERERAALKDLLLREDAGLVTLTGPGGVGKTSLGLEIAGELASSFEDGAFLVSLASVEDARLVVPAIASVLDLHISTPDDQMTKAIEAHLRFKQTLILLDNFEQVVAAAPVISVLLGACPRLKILATSRVPLRIRGERELHLAPLAVPKAGEDLDEESLMGCGATRLFIEHIRAARPDFKLTRERAVQVAEICRRLDGLPLAIELAAARCRVLQPKAVLSRLEDALDLLQDGPRDLPERQQTLRAAIRWSYDLLSPELRTRFARLSALVGEWDLEAAQAVGEIAAKPRPDVLAPLVALAESSLIQSVDDDRGEPRFRMLETIRLFAQERLIESGEAEHVRRCHAEHFMRVGLEIGSAAGGLRQRERLLRLDRDLANLRAALQWLLDAGAIEEMLRTATALWRLWEVRGHAAEGFRWLDSGLLRQEAANPEVRAEALLRCGWLARNVSGLAGARRRIEESLALFRDLDNERGVAAALNNLGAIALDQGDREAARQALAEAIVLRRRLGDPIGLAASLLNMGSVEQSDENDDRAAELYLECLEVSRSSGDLDHQHRALIHLGNLRQLEQRYEEAVPLYEESIGLARSLDDRNSVATTTANLGSLARHRNDLPRARELLAEGLSIFREQGNRMGCLFCLVNLARTRGAQGDALLSARVFGACETLREQLGLPPSYMRHEEYLAEIAILRDRAGPESFELAWQAGRRLSMEEAIEIVTGG